MSRDTNRYSVLCYEQVQLLHNLMEKELCIDGSGHCPSVRITLKQFVQRLRQTLLAESVQLRDVRLNGGGATYVIGMDSSLSYNDLDLLFGVDLSEPGTADVIRRCTLHCLRTFLPLESQKLLQCRHQQRHQHQHQDAMECYIRKLVRVQHNDSWFLISLGGKLTVELKFVEKMRRKYEFTVDSFQIILDSLLAFYTVKQQQQQQQQQHIISEHFYPTVVAEAVSGSFANAYDHLTRREISTDNPEQIRGGGLLKYCKLLVDGFMPAEGVDVLNLEKYMCSRFFIDFSELSCQRAKVQSYLLAHFPNNLYRSVQYLHTLYDVVQSSTVCLMQQERASTLYLLEDMIGELTSELEYSESAVALEEFNSDNWVLDQVYYGTQYFPAQMTLSTSQQQQQHQQQQRLTQADEE